MFSTKKPFLIDKENAEAVQPVLAPTLVKSGFKWVLLYILKIAKYLSKFRNSVTVKSVCSVDFSHACIILETQ